MPKYMMIILAGAVATWFAHKYSKIFAWILAAATAFFAYTNFRQGG